AVQHAVQANRHGKRRRRASAPGERPHAGRFDLLDGDFLVALRRVERDFLERRCFEHVHRLVWHDYRRADRATVDAGLHHELWWKDIQRRPLDGHAVAGTRLAAFDGDEE